jgi:ribosomal protein S27E
MRFQCPNCKNQTLRFRSDIMARNLICEHCNMVWIGYANEFHEHP